MTSEATVPEAALLPCPFCGGTPVIRRLMQKYPADAYYPAGEYEAWVKIVCDTCGIQIGDEYRSRAIDAWNRRAALPHLSTAIHDAAIDSTLGEINSWLSANHIPLLCGEMTAQELRNVKAVLSAVYLNVNRLKSIPAPAEGNEAEAAQEPPHLKFRREAVAKALTLDATDFIFNFDEEPDNDTVEGFAATLAIILAGYAFTLDDKGRLAACVAGDQGYAVTGIVVDEEGQFGLSAAPAQAPGELPWRDMSTAPKDGTHLLVKLPGETTPPTVAHWFQPVPGDGEGGWYLSVQQIAGPAIEPIGWLPIAALTRQEQRGAVEIKPLEWKRESHDGTNKFAESIVGKYQVWAVGNAGYFCAPGQGIGTKVGTTIGAAKAAAQADYEARIRSALAATPVHQEGE